MARPRQRTSVLRWLLHRLWVFLGAAGLTLAFFLVLPLMQTISRPPESDLVVRDVYTGEVPSPPPPPEEEPEEEPEPQEQPPEFEEKTQPLTLEQLELVLNPTAFGEGNLGAAELAVKLFAVGPGAGDLNELFSLADLDQKPRVLYQPQPTLNSQVRKMLNETSGKVVVIFIVNERGRVEDPIVQTSSHPAFEKPALGAVQQWKFEPGKRGGKPVKTRMRVPITFPKRS